MELIINGEFCGKLDDNLVKRALEKYEIEDAETLGLMFIDKIFEECVGMSVPEKLEHVRNETNQTMRESIAEMIAPTIRSELRPPNEVCKNCSAYYNQFCAFMLWRADPFAKGCDGWKEREDKSEKVTDIFDGYTRRIGSNCEKKSETRTDRKLSQLLMKLRVDDFLNNLDLYLPKEGYDGK